MKHLPSCILSLFLGLASVSGAEAVGPLIWSDEFADDGPPDPAKWDHRQGGDGWGNHELQHYTARRENTFVRDGHLVIVADREEYEGNQYTSGAVLTHGRQDFLYGRVEVRAKVPAGVGAWSAIWLLGNGIHTGQGWPLCGEIDIMENVGFEPNVIHANVHTQAYHHSIGTNKGDQIALRAPDEKFHVYAIEWRPERIDFLVDDIKYFSFAKESADVKKWPFDQPHHLIINLAIGGDWGGRQGVDDRIFPLRYEIDYVRYYALDD